MHAQKKKTCTGEKLLSEVVCKLHERLHWIMLLPKVILTFTLTKLFQKNLGTFRRKNNLGNSHILSSTGIGPHASVVTNCFNHLWCRSTRQCTNTEQKHGSDRLYYLPVGSTRTFKPKCALMQLCFITMRTNLLREIFAINVSQVFALK